MIAQESMDMIINMIRNELRTAMVPIQNDIQQIRNDVAEIRNDVTVLRNDVSRLDIRFSIL